MTDAAPRFSRTFSGYGVNTVSRSIAAGGISAKYRRASSSDTPASGSVATPVLELDLQPYLKGTIVEGSLLFTIGSYRYCDRGGILYHSVNRNTGAATQAGTINYATGKASITAWPAGAWSFSLEAGLVNPGTPGMSGVVGRTASRPLKSQSFSFAVTALDGSPIAATAASNGTLVATLALGTIDAETGVYKIDFGQVSGGAWASKLVDPGTLLYNAVAYSYLPLDADQIGIDPVRLPTDGKVPIFRPGDFAVLGYTKSITATVSNGQTINATMTRLSRVRVLGANGALITSGYSADLDNGTITFNNVAGYSQPVTIQARIEDMARVSDVQISGEVSFTRQISHAYPVPGSYLSGALVLDDLYAHVKSVFDQQTWASTWSDTVSGNAASGTYDKTGHPIEVTNAGAVTERWAIVFSNTTSFNVHAEHLGVIATGNTATDLAPLNPVTGQPYFTLRAAGWGLGWAAGNALRFNTVGAIAPVWIARTVQQGAATAPSDAFELLVRGDVDAP